MTLDEFKTQVTTITQEFLSSDVKDAIIIGLKDTVLPALKEIVEPFTTQLKNDAANEQGWTKFRDGVLLPGIVSFSFWLADKLLGKCLPATTTQA